MSSERWAVMISGRGSNLAALLEVAFQFPISVCVTSRKNAYGVLRARRQGIPCLWFRQQDDWMGLHQELVQRQVHRIFLLGFMRLLPPEFVDLWAGRIYNLHPSLLPKFPGKDGFLQSYQSGESMGATVHEVVAEMDAGPIVLQKSFGCALDFADQSAAQLALSQTEQGLVRKLFMSNFSKRECS